MIDRQRIATFGIATTAVATVALALWLKPWASGSLTTPKPQPIADGHRIDVVFAVDTTGSMGGLLDGAKRTVWSIASHIREVDKNADVHVGLVAYKDLGDVYVTKDFPLTSDMDGVFAELSTYTAEGGGDVPEDVDAALDDAVHKMAWRDGAKKMIFLVGDAPPASRGEVPRFDVSARDAAGKGIMINTIRCGTASDTAEAWQQIASIGAGEFSSIQQNGGVQQIATPYDQKMAELSHTIDSTAVIYGDAATRGAYEGKMAVQAAAPAAVAADRADYYAKAPAKKGMSRAKEDVVGGVATGTVAVESLDKDMLPADMKNKSTDEIKAEISERAAKRDAAQAELAKVAKERADYLKAHEKEAGEGFDVKVKATVDRELAK
jgi:hypothetical protein